jgi:PAS domain S-box-containing protein
MKTGSGNIYTFSGCETRIDKLISSLKVGVLLQGPDSEILYSNEAALNLLGLTEDELYGRSSHHPDWNVIHEDGTPFPGYSHPVPMAIHTKKPVANIVMGVYRPITKDRIWLLVNAEPLLDDNGSVKEVICSFSDITDRKEAEEKMSWLYQSLELRAFELATTNADLERFVSVATHELQEPLRLVNSFMQLLKKKYEHQLDEQAQEYINHAVVGSTRLKKLILDLLEYSGLKTKKEDFVSVDMNKIVKDVCSLLEKEIKQANAEIIIETLPVLPANPSLIARLFENLLNNAIKFRSNRNPVIHINSDERTNDFIFSISDNGIGIDPVFTEKIFVLFQRLHHNNIVYEGTGAGLAICRKIVEIHKGNIWVEPENGSGCTFYFTIPKNHQEQ